MSVGRTHGLLSSVMLAIAMLIVASPMHGVSRADIMDVDLSGVPPQYRSAFVEAERFWETRIIGFSGMLPRFVSLQLTKIQITAVVQNVDGPGGVLGFAGPSQTFDFQNQWQTISVAQAANMTFDLEDAPGLLATGLLDDVVRHEMAHALGFGPLWGPNNLNAAPFGNYVGAFGLRQYRKEANDPFAQFVPVEQQGGGGTAGGHWDSADPFFFDPNTFAGDLMIGFLTDNPTVSETTWASFADLWFKVRGVNDRITGGIPIPNGPKTTPPRSSFTSVPEPTHAVVLFGLALAGLAAQRRRR